MWERLIVLVLLVTPFCARAEGVLVLGESLSWQILIGGAITIAGVAIIVLRRPMEIEAGV